MSSDKIVIKNYKGISPAGERFGSFLVFMIWPILGVFFSFVNYKFKNSKNIIWFFNVFVGLTFNFASGSDSSRYKDALYVLYVKRDYTLTEFWRFLTGDGSNSIDIIQPLLNFIVSRFTSNPYVLFGVYGFVFGYFFSRNIWFLFNKVKGNIKIEALAYIIMFIFLVPFWQINGFRFWTATHIYLFAVLNYFSNKKTKGIVFLIVAVLMHYTYILGVAMFIGKQIFGNKIKIYFYGYLISIFFTFVNLEFVSQLLEKLPGNVQDKTKVYVNEEYAEGYFESESSTNWYILYRYTMLKTLVAGSFIWMFYYRRSLLTSNKMMMNLFSISLLFMSFGNITSSIPAMLRFFYIGYMAMAIVLFMFFQLFPFKRRPDWYKVLSMFIIVVTSLVELRVGFENLTVSTVISNFFTFFLVKDGGGSILQWIKG